MLNLNNWQLTLNGTVLTNGITNVQYIDRASSPNNEYEVVITFDGDPTTAGNQPLGGGRYILTLKDSVQDIFGNKLDGDYNGTPGGNFNWSFTVSASATGGSTGPGNSTLPGNPKPPTADNPLSSDIEVNTYATGLKSDPPDVAIDPNGDYVVVWAAVDTTGHYVVEAQRFDKYGEPADPSSRSTRAFSAYRPPTPLTPIRSCPWTPTGTLWSPGRARGPRTTPAFTPRFSTSKAMPSATNSSSIRPR